ILQLIKELQQQSNMGVIFITHDLGVVAEVADRAAVMYKGGIVETNSVKEIFSNPQHPYTKALIACRPVNHPRGERLPVVSDFLEGRSKNMDVGNQRSEVISQHSVLLRADHLSVWFPARKTFFGKPVAYTKAVDDVSFEV